MWECLMSYYNTQFVELSVHAIYYYIMLTILLLYYILNHRNRIPWLQRVYTKNRFQRILQ